MMIILFVIITNILTCIIITTITIVLIHINIYIYVCMYVCIVWHLNHAPIAIVSSTTWLWTKAKDEIVPRPSAWRNRVIKRRALVQHATSEENLLRCIAAQMPTRTSPMRVPLCSNHLSVNGTAPSARRPNFKGLSPKTHISQHPKP